MTACRPSNCRVIDINSPTAAADRLQLHYVYNGRTGYHPTALIGGVRPTTCAGRRLLCAWPVPK